MTDRYILNETRSPIDPSSWSELNENWELIKSYLRFLERQIKFLSGGNEIDDILLRIDTAISNANSATADVEQARGEFNSILNEVSTLVSNAETATENANIAANNANTLNTALTTLKNEIENLQTNLNGIVQAESERVSNEQNRVTAEQRRDNEETTRRENEAARVLKEQSRETTEQNRKTTFDAQILTTEQKITMMQYLIDNLKSYDFDLNTTFNFPNLIKWNGSTFIALQEVTGLTPVDDGINYRLVAQRGVDGTGAVSSVNGNGPDANGNVEVIMSLVNNLVSDSTTAGLTAAQGKALKVLFDGLQQVLNTHISAIDNPHEVSAEQVALGNVQNFGVATQAEAETGSSTDKYMTPQRTKQAIDKNLVTISQSVIDLEGQVTQHLADDVFVTQFGAKGDGVTDDSVAINSALANGGTVRIPKGTFLISNSIVIPSQTTLLIDPNAIIKLANNANCYMIKNSDTTNGNEKIKVIGGIWDGNAANQTRNYTGNLLTGYFGMGMLFFKVKGLEVAQMVIKETEAWGVSYFDCENCIFDSIEFDQPLPETNENKLNSDGVTGFGKNIIINNISGYTNDDLVAVASGMAVLETADVGFVFGNSDNVTITNIFPKPKRGTSVLPWRAIALYAKGDTTVSRVSVRNVKGKCKRELVRVETPISWEVSGRKGTFENLYFSDLEKIADINEEKIIDFGSLITVVNTNVKSISFNQIVRRELVNETSIERMFIKVDATSNVDVIKVSNVDWTVSYTAGDALIYDYGKVGSVYIDNINTNKGGVYHKFSTTAPLTRLYVNNFRNVTNTAPDIALTGGALISLRGLVSADRAKLTPIKNDFCIDFTNNLPVFYNGTTWVRFDGSSI